jgi:hypothetical protein
LTDDELEEVVIAWSRYFSRILLEKNYHQKKNNRESPDQNSNQIKV